MKFNVVLFTPKNYNHTGVFFETADLIYFSLKKLNFEVTKSEKIINDRKNIILGINLLKFYPKKNFKFPGNSVIINFEAFEHKEFFDNYTLSFLKNYEVWDFNLLNAEKINKHYGTKIKKVLPMGYCQELKKFSYLSTKKDIDVLFMGSLSARRKQILSNLFKMGLNVKHIFGIYGDQKDSFIKRAHLHLNIHYYGPRVLEPFRINYYLINGCPIVSESSSDSEENDMYKDVIVFEDYEKIAFRAFSLVNDLKKLSQLSTSIDKFIKSRDIAQYIKELL